MIQMYIAVILSMLHFATSQIDRTGWTVTADSFQPGNEPALAIDGNTSTFWHTEFNPVNTPLPHNITVNMAKSYYVTSVTYQPRQDGNSNGNIGQHQVMLSTDGVKWSSAAIGTYLDDSSTKTTTFIATPAQYVRIVGVTEAGNRGPWTSVSEINVFASSTYTPASNSLGQWSTTVDFPLVPAAAAVLANGKVLAWSSYSPNTFTGNPGSGFTVTATYDPVAGVVSQRTVTNTQHDMFCPGLSMDGNGRPLVTGGNNAEKLSIYSPGADAWTSGPNMNIPRGYQASAILSDGRMFVIGGSWSGGSGGKNGEIYNPTANTWSLLSGCPVAPMLTADTQGVYRYAISI